jgi:D-threo-aldose 1-dehydrogenase
MAPDGAVAELVRMREQGEIRYVSAGLNDADMLLRFARTAPRGTFDSFMCAGCWNLLDQTAYDLLRVCQARGIRVTNAGVFGSGILWGGDTLRYAQADADAIARVAQWESLAREYTLPLPAVALAFALLPEAVENVAIGCRSPAEVQANVALLRYTVPPQLWSDAQNRGLLPSWMPLPSRA